MLPISLLPAVCFCCRMLSINASRCRSAWASRTRPLAASSKESNIICWFAPGASVVGGGGCLGLLRTLWIAPTPTPTASSTRIISTLLLRSRLPLMTSTLVAVLDRRVVHVCRDLVVLMAQRLDWCVHHALKRETQVLAERAPLGLEIHREREQPPGELVVPRAGKERRRRLGSLSTEESDVLQRPHSS